MRYKAYYVETRNSGFLGLKTEVLHLSDYPITWLGPPSLFCGYCDSPIKIEHLHRWEESIKEQHPLPPGVSRPVEKLEKTLIAGRARCSGCGAFYRGRVENRPNYYYNYWASSWGRKELRGYKPWGYWETTSQEEFEEDVYPGLFSYNL